MVWSKLSPVIATWFPGSLPHFKSWFKYRQQKKSQRDYPVFVWLRASHNDRSEYPSCSHTRTHKCARTHNHTVSLISHSIALTHCSCLQSSVSYWPSVSLPIQLSVCACVLQCEGVTDPDGDGFIITRRSLLFLLLFHCCFYCCAQQTQSQGAKAPYKQRGRFTSLCWMMHPKTLQTLTGQMEQPSFFSLYSLRVPWEVECQIHHHRWHQMTFFIN